MAHQVYETADSGLPYCNGDDNTFVACYFGPRQHRKFYSFSSPIQFLFAVEKNNSYHLVDLTQIHILHPIPSDLINILALLVTETVCNRGQIDRIQVFINSRIYHGISSYILHTYGHIHTCASFSYLRPPPLSLSLHSPVLQGLMREWGTAVSLAALKGTDLIGTYRTESIQIWVQNRI